MTLARLVSQTAGKSSLVRVDQQVSVLDACGCGGSEAGSSRRYLRHAAKLYIHETYLTSINIRARLLHTITRVTIGA